LRLPHAGGAYVPRGKVKGYLLSLSHPLGRSKARFFRGIGFDEQDAELLETELLRLAREGTVVERIPGDYGTKYIVRGGINTPAGERVSVTTVWLIETGQVRPRLVTAYPGEGSKGVE